MSKIKSFLLAFSLSPLFLSTFQLPSQAQLTTPSLGGAANPSGAATTVNFIPKEIVLFVKLSETQKLALNESGQKAYLVLQERQTLAARVMIGARFAGTPDQVLLSNRLIGAGVDPALATKLVTNISGLVAPQSGGAVKSSRKNSSSPNNLLKSLMATEKEWVIAQEDVNRAAKVEEVVVDPEQLSRAIAAYNEIVDTSTPETLATLVKDEEFTLIGQTIRSLRASVR
jgi:hypothetical protein